MRNDDINPLQPASYVRQAADGGKMNSEGTGPGRAKTVRVLHIIDSLVAGGKERQLLELLKGLQLEDDFACELVIMSNEVQYEAFWHLGVKAHFLPRAVRFDPSIFYRLFRVMRNFQPHVVHSWNSMCSIYGAPVAKLIGAKFVNGYVRAAPPDMNVRDRDYLRGKITTLLSDIVVSNSVTGLSAYRVPYSRGRYIHNGFDQQRLEGIQRPEEIRRELGITTRHVVGMVASFTDKKDYDVFFRMARQVSAVRDDVTFVTIGDGDHLKRFEAMIATDAFPRIRLLGRRQSVESIVNTFTVGILTSNTSLHGEGIANAIMEYMALGKPVVATECGGNRELVEEGETGYLIAGGDTDTLTRHVLNLLDDPVLSARLGESGRSRIRDSFSLERMTQSYARLYRRVIR
jgi:glycosyltransferase involved in cell wall biosynthesis